MSLFHTCQKRSRNLNPAPRVTKSWALVTSQIVLGEEKPLAGVSALTSNVGLSRPPGSSRWGGGLMVIHALSPNEDMQGRGAEEGSRGRACLGGLWKKWPYFLCIYF